MIEKVYNIAKEAGQVIREGFGKHFSIEFKTNSSNLVTEIDKKSEKLIIDFINKEYPGHSIIAEESGAQSGSSDFTWVVDPLDGTTNFAHGLPIFSVSIGVQKKGETIIGVIYDVMSDKLYSAEKGNGAFCDGRKLGVNINSNLEESLLVTGFPYNIKEDPFDVVKKFNDFLLTARAVRRLGSAAIDFCYVASGVFDGFWEVHLSPWDFCAGELIVTEAGGKVTDFNGNPITLETRQFLASNGVVHDEMLKILNNSG